MRFYTGLVVIVSLVSSLSFAETPDAPGTATGSVTATAQPASSLFGKLELRPTWGTSAGKVDAQNNVELGYAFTPNTRILFNQGFNFDLRNTKSTGTNVTLPDARIEADFNRAWEDRSTGLSLDYQPRLHVPTDTIKRDNGLITEFRHQLNLTKRYTDVISFTTSLIPAVHAYSKRGGNATGVAAANPFFENQVEFVGKFQFSSNWKVEVPLKFNQKRFQDFAPGALLNDRWAFAVTVKPEVTYAIDRRIGVGFAFETGNMIADDFSKTAFGDAFKNANAQVALIATL